MATGNAKQTAVAVKLSYPVIFKLKWAADSWQPRLGNLSPKGFCHDRLQLDEEYNVYHVNERYALAWAA
jgi:hypothetical protein